jgi:hypothetical protein
MLRLRPRPLGKSDSDVRWIPRERGKALFLSSRSLLASLLVRFGCCLRSYLMELRLVAEAMKMYQTLPTYSDRIAAIG